ncbi:MAG: AAA family ATPase, partial [Bacteroidota bacterium]
MSELLKAFDSYKELVRESYFTLSFEELGSTLILEVPLESSKDNMDKVLDLLALPPAEFELVYKSWHTDDSSNADRSEDFASELLFKSRTRKCIIFVDLNYDSLMVEFTYHCLNTKLEEWVIAKNHAIRSQLGLKKTPTFKVLTRHRNSCFGTEDVRTEHVQLDLSKNYNDDFPIIHEAISKSFSQKNSGLILLYGEPGTGKTTYIKGLISEYEDMNFIFIQNEFVHHLLDPDFIAFLLKQRNAVLVIEDAEKVLKTREGLGEGSVVSTILQLTDGLFSDYLNIKIICT